MSKSKIQWTEETWNPVRGCSRVSKGCESCYAETFAGRFSGPGKPWEGFVKKVGGKSRWTGRVELLPQKLEEPLKRKKPTTYFVNSMSDLFHEGLTDGEIDQVFAVMAIAQQHTFQVLTKRPERMVEWFRWINDHKGPGIPWGGAKFAQEHGIQAYRRGETEESLPTWNARSFAEPLLGYRISIETKPGSGVAQPWPLPNVMLGVSAEDQDTADERIPLLLQAPAAVRFVSAEPLLDWVDFTHFLPKRRYRALECYERNGRWGTCAECWAGPGGDHRPEDCPNTDRDDHNLAKSWIDWAIIGGESGPNARPCNIDWIRSIVRQCQNAGVPVFVKQLGARPRDMSRCQSCLDPSICWCVDSDIILKDPKGGNPQEWPEDLRVREFPKAMQAVTP